MGSSASGHSSLNQYRFVINGTSLSNVQWGFRQNGDGFIPGCDPEIIICASHCHLGELKIGKQHKSNTTKQSIAAFSCEPHGISNHWQLNSLFNSLFSWQQRYHQSSASLALFEENLLVASAFLSWRASNVVSVSMSWHHQGEVVIILRYQISYSNAQFVANDMIFIIPLVWKSAWWTMHNIYPMKYIRS